MEKHRMWLIATGVCLLMMVVSLSLTFGNPYFGLGVVISYGAGLFTYREALRNQID